MSQCKIRIFLGLFILPFLAAVFVAGPLRAADTGPLRVLTYHRFDTGAGISTPMKQFKKQMHYLMDNDFNFLTIEQVHHHLRAGRPFPAKSVLLMIDDGYRSVHYNAYPFLKKHGLPAVINIYPRAQVGNYSAYITWDTVARMARDPLIHIGNHSYSHSSLLETNGDTRTLQEEVIQAGKLIRDHTGEAPLVLALPYGIYDQKLMSRLDALDSRPRLIFSTLPGVVEMGDTSMPYQRFIIDRYTDMERFKSILRRKKLELTAGLADGGHMTRESDTLNLRFRNLARFDTKHLHLFLNGKKLTKQFRATADTDTWQFTLPEATRSSWNQLMIIGLDQNQRIYRTFSMGFTSSPAPPEPPKQSNQPDTTPPEPEPEEQTDTPISP